MNDENICTDPTCGAVLYGGAPLIHWHDDLKDAKWKQIPDFPDYWVSDDGRVINLRTKHVLTSKQRPGFNFRVVRLNKENKQYERSIHALQQRVFD